MAAPILSVIMPTYNHGAYIAESLESIFSQAVSDLEVIIVDDGSTDITFEVIDGFLRRYGAEKVILLKQNRGGPAAARNLGISKARGRLVAFLDSDDVWLPGTLRKRLDYLVAHPEVVLVSSDVTNFGEKGIIDESYFRSRHCYEAFKASSYDLSDLFTFILDICMVFTSTVVVRKECLVEMGGFDRSFPVGEDKELYFRIGRRYKMTALPEIMLLRRIHSSNISSGDTIRRKTYLAILDKIKNQDPSYYAANKQRLDLWGAKMHQEYGYYLFEGAQYRMAVSQFAQSIITSPSVLSLRYFLISLICFLVGAGAYRWVIEEAEWLIKILSSQ